MKKSIVRRAPSPAQHTLPDSLHPVLARVYAAREVVTPTALDRSLNRLPPPGALAGMEEALDLLGTAIESNARILVVADFDADGATSCALALLALRRLGATDVHYLVPNRFEFGYGLTPEIVAVAARLEPDLIVTVDNGISSIDGVRAAQAAGISVLITDHHLPGAELPPADAIVNPNRPGDAFPSKHLAGVGVVFYVMLALRARLREVGWFGESGVAEPNLAELLDLVAVGTVADVVALDETNRILVAQGLARINAGRCRPGVRALLEIGKRRLGRIVAADLGFVLGPRLNAAGRLEDMALGIECLLTDDIGAAAAMAQRLDELNRERREIQSGMQQQATRAIADLHLADNLPRGVCLFDAAWHQGVIGILASRVREQLHRPVIAFAPADKQELKGSARSVPGLHIRDALDAIAARHPHLLHKFGGHAMAAGLSLRREHFAEFAAAFDAEVGRHLGDADFQGVVVSDGELNESELGLALAESLRDGGPWGQGFPEPVFDGVFDVLTRRVVGERHLKLQLRPVNGASCLDAIAFHAVVDGVAPAWTRVRAAYRVDVNEYQDSRALQLIIEHMEAC